MTAELPNLRLKLSNRPENVSLVRDVLAGVAEAVGLDSRGLDNLKAAVTEACNNVVLHAYEGEEGPLELDLYASSSAIAIVVRDHGKGFRPRVQSDDEGTSGIGLRMIRAMVDNVEFRGAGAALESEGSVGTEVRMTLAAGGVQALEPLQDDGPEPPAITQTELATTVAVGIAASRLAHAVLPRLLGVLAARAEFSTDRISDARRFASVLVARAPESISGGHLNLGIRVQPRDLELRIAPLRTDGARDLMADSDVDGHGELLSRLVGDRQVAPGGHSEMLLLRLVDRA